MKTLSRLFLVALFGLFLTAAAHPAQAAHLGFSIGIGPRYIAPPPYYGYGYGYARPYGYIAPPVLYPPVVPYYAPYGYRPRVIVPRPYGYYGYGPRHFRRY